MQRSPPVYAGTSAIPGPEDSADLEPPLHATPPPVEVAEPPDSQPPKQIRAHTNVLGEPLESLRDEAAWRAMGQMGPTSAHAPEGKTPIGEVRGHLPDFPNPQTQGSVVLAPRSVEPTANVRATQARRPVPDEGGRVRLDPWPNPGVVIISLDSCLGSAITARGGGGQNIFLPRAESEQYHVFHKFSSFPPRPSTCHHLTPFHARIRRERAPPPNGAPPTSALNAGNWETCVLKTWRIQGERQHWTTHLSSLAARKTSITLGLYAQSRKPTRG